MHTTKRTRPLGLIAGASALALVLTACGLGDPGDSAPEPQDLDDAEIAGTITFQTMQLSPTFDDLINGYIEEFEDMHPEVTVNWVDVPTDGTAQKINADAASGNLADVLNLDSGHLTPLAREGRVLDMSAMVPEAQDDYLESAWEVFAIGGPEISALPWYLNTPVLVVNTTIMEEAGLDEIPRTYFDMMDASAVIGEETEYAGFQLGASIFKNALLATGTPIVNDDATEAVINTPEAQDLVERLHALYLNGGIPADSITAEPRSGLEVLSEGRVAFGSGGPNQLRIVDENAPDLLAQLEVHPPIVDENDEAWLVAHGLAVPTTSENQATAIEFARFVTNSDNQLLLANESVVFPSTPDALNQPFFTEAEDDLVDQGRAIAAQNLLDERVAPQSDDVDREIEGELWSQMQLALMGDEEISIALERTEEAITSILQGRAE
ncbi:ABC transporter substrate-binding protein [Pseudactinotalea sp. Z1732]|uniref:ABC transporter substrate-binding protein n=1 Tax=Pseudactinotalea sp. Z1732 TaxID=3413026 RepID=UPI003C7DF3AB